LGVVVFVAWGKKARLMKGISIRFGRKDLSLVRHILTGTDAYRSPMYLALSALLPGARNRMQATLPTVHLLKYIKITPTLFMDSA
jgi:hypothetical protein